MTDITTLRNNSEKKTVSVAAARVLHSDVGTVNIQELFNLPANCLIINSGIVVEVAGQGGLTVDFGFDGGTELGSAVAISSTGYKQNTLPIASLTLIAGTPNTLSAGAVTQAPRILTNTGKTVTAKFSADPSAGDFTFIVEYIEYKLGNGKLMAIGNGV